MNKIEFKKYTHWPNIKSMNKMLENDESNYEYIGFCFEISMLQENKTTNAYFAGYLFLDFHEKTRKICFDIPNAEDDSNNFFLYRIDHLKNKVKKEIVFENGCEIVIMKPETTSTIYDISASYNKLTRQFIEKDMKDKFDEVRIFLDTHSISYEKQEVDKYCKEFLDGAKKFFSDKLLPDSIINKYSEVNSLLLYEKMNANLAESPIKKARKI